MRRSFPTMGTVASLATAEDDPDSLAAVQDVFAAYEARFSRYRSDSELSAVIAGRVRLADSSALLRDAYAAAMAWRSDTRGDFSPHRPDGTIDLDGIVKAQAIAAAGRVLDARGPRWWTLAVGGDVLTSAGAPPDVRSVGVVDPADRTAMLTVVTLAGSRRAIATSGSAERGDHIWLSGRGAPPDFVQATVLADDIVTADVLATAVISGGRFGLDEITERWNVDILAVDRAGALLATPGFRGAIAA
jgi:thiamine biosynthesis lipoprotein